MSNKVEYEYVDADVDVDADNDIDFKKDVNAFIAKVFGAFIRKHLSRKNGGIAQMKETTGLSRTTLGSIISGETQSVQVTTLLEINHYMRNVCSEPGYENFLRILNLYDKRDYLERWMKKFEWGRNNKRTTMEFYEKLYNALGIGNLDFDINTIDLTASENSVLARRCIKKLVDFKVESILEAEGS